ncbi:radical SAM family heme chaperone HemW [Blastochloris tepida]|uniref:Heme chaperone HemW n=1 Tax=Blastochloris tepida TaxID=2233851 RepID=A0A348G4Q0_9HYPH|nr:radical SAM family heme chaperone HemW [Blastochloris tepida]BBF94533.1 coproporphyrinogen III oxidase [Blastochloris tepida]
MCDDDADPGFAVYVHWPFCLAKCPYCDFNSFVRPPGTDEARYARAVTHEIAATAQRIGPRTVRSIFLGGGTPSLMQPATVAAVLEAVAEQWSLADDIEITIEANPTSVEAERFRGYRDAGVNRVSLGVQALNDADLKALGRMHTAAEALAALEVAQNTFARVSFDLIYARPGQTVADWQAELTRALAFGTEHLSAYQLTIEEGTPFFALQAAGRLATPDPELARALFDLTQALTFEAGLPAYEVSNHARPGAESRHNLIYWRSGEYAGFGPGAHGRLMVEGRRRALAAERDPAAWLARIEAGQSGAVTDEALSRDEIGDEFLLMGLRLAEGIDLNRFAAMSGRSLDPARIADLAGFGFIERTGDRLRVTAAGLPILDAVVADLAA